MIFNMVPGKAKVATLTVTTSASATVKAVNGSITLTATANSSGTASFSLPKSGTWTVTATKGSTSKNGTVSITTYGQSASISLVLSKYLITDGVANVTMGACTSGGATSAENWNSKGYWYLHASMVSSGYASLVTKEKIDLSGFSNLYINGTWNCTSNYNKLNYFDSFSSGNYPATTTAIGSLASAQSSVGTKSISLSSVTGSHYLQMYVSHGYDMAIHNMWLG